MDTPAMTVGRETCGDAGQALEREWLVTNGLGGYAAGTVALAPTRRYHGLLVAAVRPPAERMLLATALWPTAHYLGQRYHLYTAEWAGGELAPRGFQLVERFVLDGGIPTWQFALADALVEQRVWMRHGANTTYVTWQVLRAQAPLGLEIRALVAGRDHHAAFRRGHHPPPAVAAGGEATLHMQAPAGPAWRIAADRGTASASPVWVTGLTLRAETARGLPDSEDAHEAGQFHARLHPGETLAIMLTAEPGEQPPAADALADARARTRVLLAAAGVQHAPQPVQQIVLAADQFVVARPADDQHAGASVIAGYPWFTDWGRDTMIALPGLTLATGRPQLAAAILQTFARYLDQGMLPNRFPDQGETPEYNTVDATLWYLHAVWAYAQATGDLAVVQRLWPALCAIVAWHERGTRYGIGLDPRDGLLRAGEPGVQLTWMDVKIGDRVVTPRTGKPVEVNALWIHGLRALAELGTQLGMPEPAHFRMLAERAEQAFLARFSVPGPGGPRALYDVVDGPGGDDATFRPNQLLAVSLEFAPLAAPGYRPLARAIVDACGARLLTSHGLRSLTPDDPRYAGRFGGDQPARDAVYHQGTVWGWLIGPYVEAYLRVYGDRATAAGLLAGLFDHLTGGAIGTLSEIFDGDPPHAPRGCFAQAWTVAEVVRAWRLCQGHA